MDNLKMYIVLNSDLGMTPGKMASQACHVVHLIVDEIIRNGLTSISTPPEFLTYLKWNNNCTKIILKASESKLLELIKMKNVRAFYDSGNTTQVKDGSLTCIGFFPCTEKEMKNILDDCKLVG